MFHQNSQPDLMQSEEQEYWANKLKDSESISLHTIESGDDDRQPATDSVSFSIHTNSTTTRCEPKHILGSFLALLTRYTSAKDMTIGFQTNHQTPIPVRLELEKNTTLAGITHLAFAAFSEGRQYPLSPNAIRALMPEHLRTSLLSPVDPFDIRLAVYDHHTERNRAFESPCALLDIEATLHRDHIEGSIIYKPSLFSLSQMQHMSRHLIRSIDATLNNPDYLPSDIPMLFDDELRSIGEFNNTAQAPHYPNMSVPEILHAVAQQAPEQTALVYHPEGKELQEPIRWSYRKFDTLTTQVANYLLDHCHAKQGDHIGVSITRGLEQKMWAFGIMKAGLVYVPLDGDLFEHKVENTGVSLFLVDNKTEHLLLRKENRKNIQSDEVTALLNTSSTKYSPPKYNANNLAYIMSGSGTSSGVPKYPMLHHGGFSNLLNALYNLIRKLCAQKNLSNVRKIIHTAPDGFDASLYDILVMLAITGEVHFTCEAERRSREKIAKIIRAERIDFGAFLPGFLSTLPVDLPMQIVLSMGQTANNTTFAEWHAKNPDQILIDALGPTEGSICTNSDQIYRPGAPQGLVGRPIDHMHEYVLTEDYAFCPPDTIGEVFYSGAGIARGYYGNPELTNEKFIHLKLAPSRQKFVACDENDPHAQRFYKSGDFGCYTTDDQGRLSLKCIGRRDRTIKINGVTINLDGIAESIMTHDSVSMAVVVPVKLETQKLQAHESDHAANATPIKQEKQKPPILFAFVTLKENVRDEDQVRKMLCEHMRSKKNTKPQPSIAHPRFQYLLKIPETTNGKTDMRRLEAIGKNLMEIEQEKAPLGGDPTLLVGFLNNIWCEVLGLALNTDISEDTLQAEPFEILGGTSSMIPLIEARINYGLTLKDEFAISYGTNKDDLSMLMTINDLVESLAERIKKSNENSDERALLKRSLRESSARLHSLMFGNFTIAEIAANPERTRSPSPSSKKL